MTMTIQVYQMLTKPEYHIVLNLLTWTEINDRVNYTMNFVALQSNNKAHELLQLCY